MDGRHGEFGMINNSFWQGKKVLITGHTGFKGSWLSMWLHSLGAELTGLALIPPTNPNLFELLELESKINSKIVDIRNFEAIEKVVRAVQPEIVFHLAAQPLVRESYEVPLLTYETNVMGTANLLEAIRKVDTVRSVVVITTDKCYENREWHWGYRENEALGGYDPYSSSKACAELVAGAYRQSFLAKQGIGIATARAGNVIGGGDWAKDRLIPDCLNALENKREIVIRNPQAIRPWQHVLEPLAGYLILAEKLYLEPKNYASAWNFSSSDSDAKEVGWIVAKLCELFGREQGYKLIASQELHEAKYLKLDSSKAKSELGWHSKLDITGALQYIVEWQQAYWQKADIQAITLQQITQYMNL